MSATVEIRVQFGVDGCPVETICSLLAVVFEEWPGSTMVNALGGFEIHLPKLPYQDTVDRAPVEAPAAVISGNGSQADLPEPERSNWACGQDGCDRMFHNEQARSIHWARTHGIPGHTRGQPETPAPFAPDPRFRCDQSGCDRPFASIQALNLHRRNAHGIPGRHAKERLDAAESKDPVRPVPDRQPAQVGVSSPPDTPQPAAPAKPGKPIVKSGHPHTDLTDRIRADTEAIKQRTAALKADDKPKATFVPSGIKAPIDYDRARSRAFDPDADLIAKDPKSGEAI